MSPPKLPLGGGDVHRSQIDSLRIGFDSLSESNLDAKGPAFSCSTSILASVVATLVIYVGVAFILGTAAPRMPNKGCRFVLIIRTGGATKLGYELRERLDHGVPQDGMGCGTHYRFALCHLGNLLATATAQLKYAMTRAGGPTTDN